jgi:lipid-binding SYLF domain-containing protein
MTLKNRFTPTGGALLLAVAACLPGAQSALAQTDKPAEQAQAPKMTPAEKEAERKVRLDIASAALAKLYKIDPAAKKVVEGAVGYAVFDITSVYALVFVGQKGKGVLFDNATKKQVFMGSHRAGTGPGVGKQRVFQVFAFKTKSAMEQFSATGSTGADVTATASAGTGGVVRSFNPSIDIYQIPESGMAVQASWGGTIYKVDADLN